MTALPLDLLADRRANARPAVVSGDTALSITALRTQIDAAADRLCAMGVKSVALHADNGTDWIVTDLACRQAGIRIVPVPSFFSAAQIAHVLASSDAGVLVTDRPVDPATEAPGRDVQGIPWGGTLRLRHLESRGKPRIPAGTQKITFTSGTTGTPKGVCLSAEQQSLVAESLASASRLRTPRHLCILPLSTLLENIGGVYAPLLAGGTVVVPSLADIGLHGSSGLSLDRLLAGLGRERPDSLILVPELLRALTMAAERGWRPPSSLRFVAVGGGRVAPQLIERARHAGLPVYEGYGLSECGSVVCLNVPGADRPGTVGRPLPHVTVTLEDGEVLVSGSTFLGYVDQPSSWDGACVRTGDLGTLDADGYLSIDGRAKNQLISSFGRNIAPEWVESELLAGPLLHQAVVFGEARPYCIALVTPVDPATPDAAIQAWFRQVNQRLPDYARVLDWARLPGPLLARDGLVTENGRPKRSSIEAHYAPVIESLYAHSLEASNQ
jgi:long-subunit acyl-CoA synthetase (AMP-forming)